MELKNVIVREHEKLGSYCIVGLRGNGISEYPKEFRKLLGKEVVIANKTYKVKGIESYALHESQKQSTVAFLLKEL